MTRGRHFFEQFDDIPKIQIAVTKDDYKRRIFNDEDQKRE